MLIKYSVYSLTDPGSREIRYVGCCLSCRMRDRFSEHLRDRGDKPEKLEWIHTLASSGLRPILQVLEQVGEDGWEEAEKKWIRHYRNQGADLLNLSDGGRGCPGSIRPEEARLKSSLSLAGVPKSKEHCRHISEAKQGKPWTEKQRTVMELAAALNPEWHARYRKGEANGRAILTEEDIVKIRDLKGVLPSRKVASLFGMEKTAVLRIWNGTRWKHV